MVKEAITTTALTTSAADQIYTNIITADYRGDKSMAATCRALFGDRLADGEKILVTQEMLSLNHLDAARWNVKSIDSLEPGTVAIYNVSARDEAVKDGKWIEAAKTLPGHDVDVLETWFKSMKINAVIKTDDKPDPNDPRAPRNGTKCVLMIDGMSLQRWHLISVLIVRLLSHWFQEHPLTDWEREHISGALDQSTPDKYLDGIAEVAKKLNLRERLIRSALRDYEKWFAKDRAVELERSIRDCDSQIEDLMRRIGELAGQKDELTMTHFGYTHQTDIEPELMHYFLAHDNLELESANSSKLTFFAWTWFDGGDPEKAETIFGKRDGNYTCDGTNHGYSLEDVRAFNKALFVDGTIKVRMFTRYELGTNSSNRSVRVSADNPPAEFTHCLGNPHHKYNHCIGDYASPIVQQLQRHNVLNAIDHCIAATGTINLTESASYSHFLRDLWDEARGDIYMMPDGTWAGIKKVMEWIREQKKA